VEPSRDPISAAFVYGLGGAVAFAWFASIFADMISSTYTTPLAVHGLMGTVVGSVYADIRLRIARRKLQEEVKGTDTDPSAEQVP
jgi:hypothetical protein